eukprot:gene28635-13127_t
MLDRFADGARSPSPPAAAPPPRRPRVAPHAVGDGGVGAASAAPAPGEGGARRSGWEESEWEGRDEARMCHLDTPYTHHGGGALSRRRVAEREEQMAKSMAGRVKHFGPLGAKAREKDLDRDKWEENRMLAAGT